MSEIMLSTKALSAGYDKKIIVEGVEINAEQGKILTLIGPNGAGKSTILKTICRQLRPLGGAVYIGKDKLEDLSGNQLARSVSVLLTGRIKTEYMRCIDVVETGRYPYTGRLGVLSDNDREKVGEALRLVDAEDIAECDFDRISDGQRQRIMLAGAICREPDILILDEPTTFLDIKYKLELMNILKKLTSERHITVIMSLHELELAQRVSDTIICIKGNGIYRTGTPKEIFSGSCIEELYGVEKGSFCEAYGSPELGRLNSAPEVFIIGGGGSAVALYRSLRRKGIAFAAGIIHENDIEYPVARALASKLVTEQAFEAVSNEKYEEAMELMRSCGNAVCTLESFGTMNEKCRQLMLEAEKMGILRGIESYE